MLRRVPAALQNIRVYLFVEQKLYFYRSAGSIPNAEFAVEIFCRIKIFRAVKTLFRRFRIFHPRKCEYPALFVFQTISEHIPVPFLANHMIGPGEPHAIRFISERFVFECERTLHFQSFENRIKNAVVYPRQRIAYKA